MPINPSPSLTQKLLKTPTVTNGPSGLSKRGINPSWASKGFEGISDLILGALGVGPDSTMNRVGQTGMAALPLMGGLASRIKEIPQLAPTADEVEGLIGQMTNNLKSVPNSKSIPTAPNRFANGRFPEVTLQEKDFPVQNRVAMGFTPTSSGSPIYDESGRFISTNRPDDPAYLAHVASSRNKLPGKVNLAPSSDTVERMMSRYKK